MYQFHPANTVSLIAFLLIVFSVIMMILLGVAKADPKLTKKVMIFLFCWIGITSLIVASGLTREYVIPTAPLLFLSINVGAIVFALSRWGKNLSDLPIWMLVFFQVFRLPLELILHSWSSQGTIPETMTWTGQNFDIVTGVLALLVLVKPLQTRLYYWFFSVVGFGLLLNVLRVAMLSSPFPFSWPLENPLQLVMHMPYALIGTVCVWSALLGHLILFRALGRTNA